MRYRKLAVFLLLIFSSVVMAQSTLGRFVPEKRPNFMVQGSVGLLELYGLGLGIMTSDAWTFSLTATGFLLLQTDRLIHAKAIGIQAAKSFKDSYLFELVPLPNSLVVQPSYLFKTPKGGDGVTLCIYIGGQNTERVGLNFHSYVGISVSAAQRYRPNYAPGFKLGFNYNFMLND